MISALIFVSLSFASPGAKMVEHARELLGVPYQFGGRMKAKGDGIDCQGVLFYAAERAGKCGWKSFSVFPTKTVETRELGVPINGLAPIAAAKLDLALLEPGDILFFVGPAENSAEPSIGKLDGVPVWVWHTALYSGTGRFIVGDHFAGEVVEPILTDYLREHSDIYTGLFVLRMTTVPSPPRCRHHAPMKVHK